MTKTLTTQIASFAIAALMTLGMLGTVSGLAKAETRIGAQNAVVAQAATASHAA